MVTTTVTKDADGIFYGGINLLADDVTRKKINKKDLVDDTIDNGVYMDTPTTPHSIAIYNNNGIVVLPANTIWTFVFTTTE